MAHYFNEPSSFRSVNCKKVPGERARKACHKWNKFVNTRNKLRAEGRIQEAEELEKSYLELGQLNKEVFGNYQKKKKPVKKPKKK